MALQRHAQMKGVTDDIEQRLVAAAKAVREYEVTALRCTDLERRIEEMVRLLAVRRSGHASEQKDVERLEGLSLTRLLVSLRGARDDALARERAEADAARYRLAEATARLDAAQAEYAAARVRLDQLAAAPSTYAAVLEQKERYLKESGDPRGARLLKLADERGRLTGELHELAEAAAAAELAETALSQVQAKLGSASGWSTYDTFFGGGAISSAIKHSRLDEAARAAAYADQCLAVLRTELADVDAMAPTAPQLAVSGPTRFVDVWFDNVFTDFAVRNRIKRAQQNIVESIRLVMEMQEQLHQRAADAQARLAAIEAERRELLAPRSEN